MVGIFPSFAGEYKDTSIVSVHSQDFTIFLKLDHATVVLGRSLGQPVLTLGWYVNKTGDFILARGAYRL